MSNSSYDMEFLANQIKENVAVLKQCYDEAEADGDELAEMLQEALEHNQRLIDGLAQVTYFMSMRMDISGDRTILDYYESLDKDFIDRMMKNEY